MRCAPSCARPGTVAPRDVTVEMVLADLMASPPAEWASPLTLRGNADRIARITAAVGSTKLQRLTVGQVERMLRDMAAAGSSSDSIRRARALLARAIRRAQRDGLVHRNVAELAEVPRGTKRPSKAMTLDQVRALLASEPDAVVAGVHRDRAHLRAAARRDARAALAGRGPPRQHDPRADVPEGAARARTASAW